MTDLSVICPFYLLFMFLFKLRNEVKWWWESYSCNASTVMICYETALKQRSIFQTAVSIACTYSLRNVISVLPISVLVGNGKGGRRIRRLWDSADVALQQLHVASTGIPLKLAMDASVSLLTAGWIYIVQIMLFLNQFLPNSHINFPWENLIMLA